MSDDGAASKLSQIGGAADAASSRMEQLQNRFDRFKRMVVGVFSIAAITAFSQSVVATGSNFEQLNVSYETMLGSQERGLKMMEDTKKFAASTPFELPEVAQATKQMLAFGIEQGKIQSSLKAVGDVASGISAPLSEIAYLYGTIKTQGKAMTMDIRQFANRGIPIYDELAKITHKNGMALQKYIEDGKIGFPQIEQAFANMSGAGGKFFNLMDKQSKTTGGRISNLYDKFTYFKDSMFTKFKPAINSGIDSLGHLIDKLSRTADFVMRNSEAFKAAATFAGTFFVASKVMAFADGMMLASKAIGAAAKSQGLLNAAMAKNPYGVAALAIAGLVLWMNKLQDKQDELRDKATRADAGDNSKTVRRDLASNIANNMKSNMDAQTATLSALNVQQDKINRSIRSTKAEAQAKYGDRLNEDSSIGDYVRSKRDAMLSPLLTKLAYIESYRKSFLDRSTGGVNGASKNETPSPLDATASEINGGGKTIHSITINVNKAMNEGDFIFQSGGIKENAQEIERLMQAMWMRVLNSGTAAFANR